MKRNTIEHRFGLIWLIVIVFFCLVCILWSAHKIFSIWWQEFWRLVRVREKYSCLFNLFALRWNIEFWQQQKMTQSYRMYSKLWKLLPNHTLCCVYWIIHRAFHVYLMCLFILTHFHTVALRHLILFLFLFISSSIFITRSYFVHTFFIFVYFFTHRSHFDFKIVKYSSIHKSLK